MKGPADRVLSGFDALDQCGPSDLSFFGNPKYQQAYAESKAGAILIAKGVESTGPEEAALIGVENPTAAFDKIVRHFGAPVIPIVPGIHETASIAEDVELDSGKSIDWSRSGHWRGKQDGEWDSY